MTTVSVALACECMRVSVTTDSDIHRRRSFPILALPRLPSSVLSVGSTMLLPGGVILVLEACDSYFCR